MARRHVLLARGQQREPLVEPPQHRRRRQQANARRGELDRERQSVEARADLRGGGRVFVPGLPAGSCLARALGEELHGSRGLERRHRVLPLGPHAQRRAARDEHLRPGGARHQRADLRRGRQHLLEVVEHEQRPLLGELAREALGIGIARAEPLGDRGQDETGVRDRLQLDEERAAREVLGCGGGGRQREPRLAGAAGARQRDEPDVGIREQRLHRLELGFAADELGRRAGAAAPDARASC